jgi:hypothetical protein
LFTGREVRQHHAGVDEVELPARRRVADQVQLADLDVGFGDADQQPRIQVRRDDAACCSDL